MIVKAMPAINGVIAKNNPQPAADADNFSATLDKKLASPELKLPSKDKTPQPEQASPEPGKAEDETENRDVIDITLTDIIPVLPPQEPPTEPVSSIDPQLQQLQQLVANAVQGSVAMPALAVTPAPVASPPTETTGEQSAEGAAITQVDLAEPQGKEQQSRSAPWLNPGMPKNAPLNFRGALEGQPVTDKTTADQHDAFLSQIKSVETNQQGNTAAPIKLEVNTPLPLTPESRLSLTPDAAFRPNFSAVHDTSVSQLPAATPSPAVLNQPLGSPAWQQALSQQLSYFSRNGIHNAELRLHPEELGALQINLRLNSDQAQLHFVAENHQVRAALEAAMPHLRTSLAESGINLGQSSVGADSSSSWGAFSQSEQSSKQPHFKDEADDQTPIHDDNDEIKTKNVSYSNGINTFV